MPTGWAKPEYNFYEAKLPTMRPHRGQKLEVKAKAEENVLRSIIVVQCLNCFNLFT